MGQAWCKEKSEKAQDSKSPLDRVFVRCAHRIYPGLKEDGSVLGGATQRVTSSEIGYAGSPPRAALLRGQSIDSVDRPFHPSEWVDVNLEVPCTPRASVLSNSANQQRSSNLPKANGSRSSPSQNVPITTAGGAPVPPPRRRRRRERRPLPPKPGSGDDESEPEPHYSQLRSPSSADETSSRRDDTGLDEVEGPSADSDDEFVAIEEILQKRSLEEISSAHLPNLKSTARPKNHSTTSLPNVAELLFEDEEDKEDGTSEDESAVAKRPPRHVKTASLPRDASLGAPQTPERMFFSRQRIEEDNSIFKIDTSSASTATTAAAAAAASPDSSLLRFETDVETSTPVKQSHSAVREPDVDDEAEAGPSRSCQNRDDALQSFQNASSASRDSSLQPVAEEHYEVDRPAAAEPTTRNNEDAGYGSRSSSHLISNESSASDRELARDEVSSGILEDATVDSTCDFENLGISGVVAANDSTAAVVQRTISEESLPREMLVDDDEDEELEEDKSVKAASNELTRQTTGNGDESFLRTPPPSPESKNKVSSSDVQTSEESFSSSSASKPRKSEQQRNPSRDSTAISAVVAENGLEAVVATAVESSDNLTSMTPSLMELEAALSDMLERKDEEERRAREESSDEQKQQQQQQRPPLPLVDEEEQEEAEEEEEEDKSSDKLPEPQIVPVKRNRALEEVDADLRKVSPQPATKMLAGEEERQPAKSRLIDFQRVDRTNPFNDLKSDELDLNLSTDEPPEKPSRLHRIGLIEESIDEPLIVPTPPRRRHRSKSNLNSSNESTAIAEVFGRTYNDRLI